MIILAIDPGPVQSGWALVNDDAEPIVINTGKDDNHDVLNRVLGLAWNLDVLVIEEVVPYGQRVGREVFSTIRWSGRFEQDAYAAQHPVVFIPRRDVREALCGTGKANDADIRHALIDRWGGKEKAIGRKKAPGPLYGVKADGWSALALAVTHLDRKKT